MIKFHDVRFPEDVSWGSSGGPQFKSTIYTSHAGYEQRNVEWSQPLMNFDVSYGVKSPAQVHAILSFFRARRGQEFGFRYKNWADYTVINQPFATGDGNSHRLPIYKFYGTAPHIFYKRLRKIVRGSVKGVSLGGEELVEGRDYQIDYDSGEIALNQIAGFGTPIYCERLEFDEPVRFADDECLNVIDAYNNNSFNKIALVGVRGTFSEGSVFSPGLDARGEVDPYFPAVMTQMTFDNNLSDLTVMGDSSMFGHPVEVSGSATRTTKVFRSGAASLEMGATGKVTVNTVAPLVTSMPCTIEVFAQRPTTGAFYQPLVGQWSEGTQRQWMVRYNLSGKRIELLVSESGLNSAVIFSFPWESDSTHFDYIRFDKLPGGKWVFRLNGKTEATAQSSNMIADLGVRPTVGSMEVYEPDHGPYQGRIDAVRITSGIARASGFGDVEIPSPSPRSGVRDFEVSTLT